MALKDARKALEWAVRQAGTEKKAEEWSLTHLWTTYGENIVRLFPDKPEVIERLTQYEQGLIEALDIIKDLEEKELEK